MTLTDYSASRDTRQHRAIRAGTQDRAGTFYANGAIRSERAHRALLRTAEQIGTEQYRRQRAAGRKRYTPTTVHLDTIALLNDKSATDERIFAWISSYDVVAERFPR